MRETTFFIPTWLFNPKQNPAGKMIKAIIFDWGGVLIENPAPAMIKYFKRNVFICSFGLSGFI